MEWNKVRLFILALCVAVITFLAGYVTLMTSRKGVTYMLDDIQQSPSHSKYGRDATKYADGDICNLDSLRERHLKLGSFPADVRWQHGTDGNKTLISGFCQFQPLHQGLQECLIKRSIRKVALLGDSNTSRMARAFRKSIGKCTRIKVETSPRDRVPNPAYYRPKVDDPRVLRVHQRGCITCLSSVYACAAESVNHTQTIIVEYISLQYLLDTEITTLRVQPGSKNFSFCGQYNNTHRSLPCPQSMSTVQFILKEYFRRREHTYPDLILHFSSSHDMSLLTAEEELMAAETVARMYDMYVPRNTTIVFFSKVYEEIWKKPKRWQNITYEGKYGILEQVQRLNRATAKGLDRLFRRPYSNLYPFFDLFSMGEGVSRDWVADGIHKQPAWYTTVVKYFSMVLCASV